MAASSANLYATCAGDGLKKPSRSKSLRHFAKSFNISASSTGDASFGSRCGNAANAFLAFFDR